jgi:eukaryotic-like serine/threonine-protein kinase
MAAHDSARYDLLDQLADEFAARFRRGERPSLKEYLDQYPDLADDIRQLFPAMVEIEQVKDDPRAASERAKSGAAPALRQLGDYRVLREVGRGGMGVVYEAEQESLGRRVALKVLPLHASRDGKALARFRREAKAAARLHHTNIVPVFEVGQDSDTCFYAMQFIAGQSLDQVVEELQRLRAEGTSPPGKEKDGKEGDVPLRQIAHSLLTGQFQLKDLAAGPVNVAEGTEGYVPVPDPSDSSTNPAKAPATGSAVLPGQTDLSSAGTNRPHYFLSVARIGQQAAQALAYAHERGIIHRDVKPSNLLLDGAGVVWVTDFGLAKTEEDGLTNPGDLLGTFRYMAPERFRGEADARADIYSLGLTLYELLVLKPAFDARDRPGLIEQVKSEEPPRPRSLDPRIPRDLETVVLKAIDKEPARRYASAEAMAEDLRRFLADEPIKARRVSLPERLWRWYRRNRVVATLTAAVLLLVLTVAAGSTVAALWLGQALHDTEKEKTVANARLWESLRAQAQAKRTTHQPGQRFATLRAIQEAMKLPLPPGHSLDELRTEAIAALLLPDLEVAKEWDGWPTGSSGFAIDDAFQRYARGDKDGNVSVRSLADDEEMFPLPGAGIVSEYGGLQFSPDGRLLYQVCEGARGRRVRLWQLDGPRPVAVIDEPATVFAFQPDGRRCAVGYADGLIRLCDTETGEELGRLNPGLSGLALEWNPKRPQLLVFSRAVWRVVDVDTGKIVAEKAQPGGVAWAAWHPEGRLLAVSNHDRKIYLWDTQTGQLALPPLEGHKNDGIMVQFNRAGDRLVSNDWSNILRLWDVRTGRQLLAQPAGGTCLHFSPDDALLAADLGFPKVRLFRCHTGQEFCTVRRPDKEQEGYECRGALSADGRLFAVGTAGGAALVDIVRGEEVAQLSLPGNMPIPFLGEEALWTCGPGGLLRWPVRNEADGRRLRVGPPQPLAATFTAHWFANDEKGRFLAIPNHNQGAILWDRETKRTIALGPQDDVRTCAVSPDGRWVATGTHSLREGAGAKVWDARTGKHMADLPVTGFCSVRFSPDSKWLVTTGGRYRIWRVDTWREGPALGETMSFSNDCAFTADGKLLALGDTLGVVRLVVPDTGKEVARLTAPEQTRLRPLCFSPDGTRLITWGLETSALHVFDLRAIREQLNELGLDWDAPPLPPAPAAPAEPLQVRIELGDMEDDLVLGVNPTAEHLRGLIVANSVSLALAPLNYKGYRQRGRALARLGQHPQALEDYSAALLLMPSDHPARPEVLSRRAGNYLFLNDLPRALADLDEADKIDPVLGKSLRHLQAAQLAARASARERTKESRAAVLLLQQALTIAPDHAETCNHLAWLLVAGPRELREPKQALTLAHKATELVPEQMLYQGTFSAGGCRRGQFGTRGRAISAGARDWYSRGSGAVGCRRAPSQLSAAVHCPVHCF